MQVHWAAVQPYWPEAAFLADEFVQAGLTNLGFDLISASKSIGKKRIRTEEYELNDNDIRQLNEAGVKGRNAKEIAESLSNVNEAARINENAAE